MEYKDDIDIVNLQGFEWDKGNLAHIEKHNVKNRECEEVFFNQPLILTEDKTHSQLEERIRVYGQTNNKRKLCLIYTIRSRKIRILSARDQSRKEREEFKKKEGEQK